MFTHPALAVSDYRTKIIKRKEYGDYRFSLDLDNRFEHDNLYSTHVDLSVRRTLPILGDGWYIGGSGRQIYVTSDDGDVKRETRLQAQLQKNVKTSGTDVIPAFIWGFRTRQEYRMREGRDDTWRNRLWGKVSLANPVLGVYPFINNEIFYNFDDSTWQENRLFVGFKLPEYNGVALTVSYQFLANRRDDTWVPASALGVNIEF